MEEKKISFEESLKELELIVKKLEGGESTLDEMLELFEQGIARTKECNAQLENAEQKISILMKDSSGEMKENPFNVE